MRRSVSSQGTWLLASCRSTVMECPDLSLSLGSDPRPYMPYKVKLPGSLPVCSEAGMVSKGGNKTSFSVFLNLLWGLLNLNIFPETFQFQLANPKKKHFFIGIFPTSSYLHVLLSGLPLSPCFSSPLIHNFYRQLRDHHLCISLSYIIAIFMFFH